MRAYPPVFITVFWWVLGLLLVSGLLLLPGMLDLRLEWEVPASLMLGSRVWWAALHGLLAFAAVGVVGALFPLHIRSGWRRRKHVRSGLTLLALIIALPLTGWGIYYIADERWSVWSSVAHVILALATTLLFVIHMVLGRRTQREHMAAHSTLAEAHHLQQATRTHPPSNHRRRA